MQRQRLADALPMLDDGSCAGFVENGQQLGERRRLAGFRWQQGREATRL